MQSEERLRDEPKESLRRRLGARRWLTIQASREIVLQWKWKLQANVFTGGEIFLLPTPNEYPVCYWKLQQVPWSTITIKSSQKTKPPPCILNGTKPNPHPIPSKKAEQNLLEQNASAYFHKFTVTILLTIATLFSFKFSSHCDVLYVYVANLLILIARETRSWSHLGIGG